MTSAVGSAVNLIPVMLSILPPQSLFESFFSSLMNVSMSRN